MEVKNAGRSIYSFLFSLGGVWKFYQISSLLVFTLEIFMTQRFYFRGGFRAVSPETRRICYLVHYLVVGRLAGLYLASSPTPSPSALSCCTIPLLPTLFFSYSPEFTFLTFDLVYSYLIWIKGCRMFIQNSICLRPALWYSLCSKFRNIYYWDN